MSSKTSFWQRHAFIMGILLIVVTLGFFTAIAPTVQTIDTTGMASWEVQVVGLIQLVVTVLPTGVLAAFGWSLFGYLREKSGDAAVEYDLSRLSQTVLWFTPIITVFTSGLNNLPLATGITTGFMILKAVINQFIEAMHNPTTTTAPAVSTPTVPSPG